MRVFDETSSVFEISIDGFDGGGDSVFLLNEGGGGRKGRIVSSVRRDVARR